MTPEREDDSMCTCQDPGDNWGCKLHYPRNEHKPAAPEPAPECGTPQDHADYLDALVTAFGEDMGDGAETTLACEIERLKRLAEQAVAMRQVLGPESWHVDGEGIAKLLKGRMQHSQPCPVTVEELRAIAQELWDSCWETFAGGPDEKPAEPEESIKLRALADWLGGQQQ